MQRIMTILLCVFAFFACSDAVPSRMQSEQAQFTQEKSLADGEKLSDANQVVEKKSKSKMTEMEKDSKEAVVPPTPVTGSFLVAKILEEDSTLIHSAKIGLAAYKNGVRVALDKTRYQVALSLSASPNPDISVKLENYDRYEFDQVIEFRGGKIMDIRALYAQIMVSYTLVDLNAQSTTTMVRSVSELLAQ